MTGPRRRDPDQTGDTPTKLSLTPPVSVKVLPTSSAIHVHASTRSFDRCHRHPFAYALAREPGQFPTHQLGMPGSPGPAVSS
jgi:hypothetical protein